MLPSALKKKNGRKIPSLTQQQRSQQKTTTTLTSHELLFKATLPKFFLKPKKAKLPFVSLNLPTIHQSLLVLNCNSLFSNKLILLIE